MADDAMADKTITDDMDPKVAARIARTKAYKVLVDTMEECSVYQLRIAAAAVILDREQPRSTK